MPLLGKLLLYLKLMGDAIYKGSRKPPHKGGFLERPNSWAFAVIDAQAELHCDLLQDSFPAFGSSGEQGFVDTVRPDARALGAIVFSVSHRICAFSTRK